MKFLFREKFAKKFCLAKICATFSKVLIAEREKRCAKIRNENLRFKPMPEPMSESEQNCDLTPVHSSSGFRSV
jgi:hypothetical protein